MGHISRIEEAERDAEYKSTSTESARLIAQTEALMARMLALYNDPEATAGDQADLIASRQSLIDGLTAAVALT